MKWWHPLVHPTCVGILWFVHLPIGVLECKSFIRVALNAIGKFISYWYTNITSLIGPRFLIIWKAPFGYSCSLEGVGFLYYNMTLVYLNNTHLPFEKIPSPFQDGSVHVVVPLVQCFQYNVLTLFLMENVDLFHSF